MNVNQIWQQHQNHPMLIMIKIWQKTKHQRLQNKLIKWRLTLSGNDSIDAAQNDNADDEDFQP